MTHSQPLTQHNVVRFGKPLGPVAPRVVAAPSGLHAFASRLSAMAKLSAEELLLLQGLGRFTRSHVPHEEIGADAVPMAPRVVVSGWACRQRMLGDGRRQIISLILPGDVVGSLEHPELPSEDSFVALTPVATADAGTLAKAIAGGDPAHRGLARAARLLALHETALLRDQIVRLGRQTAYERLAHLMLELHARLQTAGTAASDSFALPVSQEVLADVLGLSMVHTNRVMQQARHDGLLEARSGQVRILDLGAMRAVADWVPAALEPSASRFARMA